MLVLIPFLCVVVSAIQVNAIPVPEPVYSEGDVVAVKPKAWGDTGNGRKLPHPAVVLTAEDANGQHLIAPVSKNLDPAVYPHTAGANEVHPELDPLSKISLKPVGPVHETAMVLSDKTTVPVTPENFAKLKENIHACGYSLTRRDGSCAPRRKMQKVKPNSAPSRMTPVRGSAAGRNNRNAKAVARTGGSRSQVRAGARGHSPLAQGRKAPARGKKAPAQARKALSQGRKAPARAQVRKAPSQGRKSPAPKTRQTVKGKSVSGRK